MPARLVHLDDERPAVRHVRRVAVGEPDVGPPSPNQPHVVAAAELGEDSAPHPTVPGGARQLLQPGPEANPQSRAANVDSRPVSHLPLKVRRALGRRVTPARQSLFLWRMRRHIGAHRFARFGQRSLIVAPRGILSPHRIEVGDGVLIHEGAMLSVVEHYRGRDHQPRLRIGSGSNIGHGIWVSCVGEIETGPRLRSPFLAAFRSLRLEHGFPRDVPGRG